MQQINNQQRHQVYHNGHTEHYHQQHQQQHAYYPTAVPYTATVAQSHYHSHMQQPVPPAAYEHNPYIIDHSSLLPHAVPALIIPTSTSDPSSPALYPFPDSAAPSTPPPATIKFGDVFRGATEDMVMRHSQPVRSLNHAQMRVWQQFESGETVRSISDHMGLKPNVVLNYIIYALESYSPSPSHPIFIHWPRFSIPPELMERVSTAMVRVGGALGRMDVVKQQLDGGGALDEDVRIAMIRWKLERALSDAYEQWSVYRVMSAEEAAERVARQRKEDLEVDHGKEEEERKEGKPKVEEEKEGGSTAVEMAAESEAMRDDTAEAKQPPPAPFPQQHTEEKEKKEELTPPLPSDAMAEPSYPPALNASEALFQLHLNGGMSQRCIIRRFERDWSEIEAVLNKLIAEQLAWKRGLLYCPS